MDPLNLGQVVAKVTEVESRVEQLEKTAVKDVKELLQPIYDFIAEIRANGIVATLQIPTKKEPS